MYLHSIEYKAVSFTDVKFNDYLAIYSETVSDTVLIVIIFIKNKYITSCYIDVVNITTDICYSLSLSKKENNSNIYSNSHNDIALYSSGDIALVVYFAITLGWQAPMSTL